MTKQIIASILLSLTFAGSALAADTKAPSKPRCTFETLEDGRTKITCPRAPIVKEGK